MRFAYLVIAAALILTAACGEDGPPAVHDTSAAIELAPHSVSAQPVHETAEEVR